MAGHWLLGQERFCFCCLRKENLHHVFTLMVVNQRGKNNDGGMGESLEHILFLSRLEGMRSRTQVGGMALDGSMESSSLGRSEEGRHRSVWVD